MEIETITKQMKKPLGQTSYGHIPHLPGSRMGPADKKCHEGQETDKQDGEYLPGVNGNGQEPVWNSFK